MTFSTLKAGRDLAATRSIRLSRSKFRFQYPQSGSRPCRPLSTMPFVPFAIVLSVPSKRVETLPLSIDSMVHSVLQTFSTLKAGRDLAAKATHSNLPIGRNFQYPQSGSRPCRRRSIETILFQHVLSVPSKRVETLPPPVSKNVTLSFEAFSSV